MPHAIPWNFINFPRQYHGALLFIGVKNEKGCFHDRRVVYAEDDLPTQVFLL